MRRPAFALLLTTLVCGSTLAPPWWQTTTGPAYQVLVYSFADSDGDGWGDLSGLQNRLETLASLGVQTLWLSPISPAVSYHGYDVTNYRGIDPRLGTLDDFDHLITAAHKRGIHVLLDIVFNHTSDQHPWFQAYAAGKVPYRDYYASKSAGITYGQTTMGNWYEVPGQPERQYFGTFWSGMPDLNNTNPEVLAEEQSVLRYWLERGVDGFRFDAAKEIFNSGKVPQNSATLAMVRKYWNDLRDFARTVNPEVLFLAEIPTDDAATTKAYAPAVDALFDFPTAKLLTTLSPAGNAVLSNGSATSLATVLDATYRQYRAVKGFVPAPFLSNHDQDRVMSLNLGRYGLSRTRGWGPAISDDDVATSAKADALARAKVQAAISLTLPGLPFIYYGEELGMTGQRSLNDDVARRDAYPWGDDNPLSDVAAWVRESGKLEADQNRSTPTWADQVTDPLSLWNHYRAWGVFRKEHPVLSSMAFSLPDAKAWKGLNVGTLSAWVRGEGKETLLVTANLGPKAQKFTVPGAFSVTALLSTATLPEASGSVTLPPLSVTVWSLN
jgi:glycosidase